MSKWAMTATFVALAIFLSVSGGAGAEQAPLRIAMTMADIPLTNGAPDQGTEGIRFLGYTVYDPLGPLGSVASRQAGQARAGARHQLEAG